MFDVAEGIIESYLASQEHEDFISENDAEKEVNDIREELIEKFGKDAKEDIDSNLFATYNIGEYFGIIQGIGIGLQLMSRYV